MTLKGSFAKTFLLLKRYDPYLTTLQNYRVKIKENSYRKSKKNEKYSQCVDFSSGPYISNSK